MTVTLGVEEEFHLVDPERRAPAEDAEQVLAAAAALGLAVAALPLVGGWLPVLLALSAGSPYLDGADTGYASYRSVLWSRWPTAGPVLPFASAAEYDAVVDALVATGTVADPGMV